MNGPCSLVPVVVQNCAQSLAQIVKKLIGSFRRHSLIQSVKVVLDVSNRLRLLRSVIRYEFERLLQRLQNLETAILGEPLFVPNGHVVDALDHFLVMKDTVPADIDWQRFETAWNIGVEHN